MKIVKANFSILSFLLANFFVLQLSGCGSQEEVAIEKNSEIANVDVFDNEKILLQLVDFTNVEQQTKLTESFIASDVNQQSKSINVKFLPTGNISSLRIEPAQIWNLTQYSNYNLAFDVTNLNKSSVHFYLSVENPAGKTQRRSISLLPDYSGTIYFPLDGFEADVDSGMWGEVPPWQTKDTFMVWRSWKTAKADVKQIAALNFFTIGILAEKNLSIGNIRLRKNPPTDPNWLVGFVDKFGQNSRIPTDLTVHSDDELRTIANKELAELAASQGMPHRSQYGGYTQAPKQKATGYFRTEKIDGKWWMVDPDGYLFFSHGPANVRMANLSTITGIDFKDPSVRAKSADEVTPEDSMGIVKVSDDVRTTKFVTSELRNKMFQWLPSYDDKLADHYSYRRSTHKGPVASGETYSFYRANLERRYGESTPESYFDKWLDVTQQRMKDWGFTSFGNWVDPGFYVDSTVPYFANGWIIGDFKTLSGEKNHWGLMPDAYDPVFAERALATIEVIAKQVKGSPWCVGIFIDNEKSWGEREGSVNARYGVILDALSKSVADSPAKQAFSEYIENKYQTIAALNNAWNSNIASWQAFQQGVVFEHYSDAQVADLSKLLEMLGEQYFTVVHNTLAAILPNHLYMGARMANWGMPDEIIKASIKYSDVLSFNIYEEGMQTHFWQFLEQVDLPVVIGEFHIGTSSDSGLYNPGIVHAADQQDRANMYKKYMKSVLEKPYMVGAHWFQYVDEPISGRAFDGENANIGFVTATDIPYPLMIEAVKDITGNMYQDRLAN